VIRSTLIALLVSLPLGAADMPEAVPSALRPLAPLVGTAWVATLPTGGLIDEQRFEWVYGGRFLRNEHWVRNAAGEVVYEGETIYAWDPLSEQIVWWYWNTTGGYVTGTMAASQGALVFEGENHAPSGQTPRVRGALRNISSTSWESVAYLDRDGEWIERWTIQYRPEGEPLSSGTDPQPEHPGSRIAYEQALYAYLDRDLAAAERASAGRSPRPPAIAYPGGGASAGGSSAPSSVGSASGSLIMFSPSFGR